MKTWIICAATIALLTGPLAGAELAWDSSSNNYLQLLDRPKSQLSPQSQRLADLIMTSKVPSRAEALRAVLGLAGSDAPYLRDARLTLGVAGLYRIGREIPGFVSPLDFVWVLHAEMAGSGLVQVFCVSSSTAKVLRLFPEISDRGWPTGEPNLQQTNPTPFSKSAPRADLKPGEWSASPRRLRSG
jgi:hypothetical protein